jgi:hypothetical protein
MKEFHQKKKKKVGEPLLDKGNPLQHPNSTIPQPKGRQPCVMASPTSERPNAKERLRTTLLLDVLERTKKRKMKKWMREKKKMNKKEWMKKRWGGDVFWKNWKGVLRDVLRKRKKNCNSQGCLKKRDRRKLKKKITSEH